MVRNIMGMIGGAIAIDALPSATGTANLKTQHAAGLSSFGTALPTVGKLKGATMVIKQAKKLTPKKPKKRKKRK